MTFDLTKLDIKSKSEAGEKMKIYSPKTGEPITNDAGEMVTITLKGRHSAAYKAAARTAQDRARERQARGVKQNDEEARNDGIDLLCAVTLDWNFTELDGQPFPCTPENIRKLWADDRFAWILIQASNFISGDGNFLAT
jgi:hypothetical protein